MNANIKVCYRVNDDKLSEYGFNIRYKEYVYVKELVNDIKIVIAIDRKTLSKVKIDVIDDFEMKNYPYEKILKRTGFQNKEAMEVHHKIQEVMNSLVVNRILKGYTPGDYV